MESRSLDGPWMIEGVACHHGGPRMASNLKASLPLPLRRPNVRYSTLQTLLRRSYRKNQDPGAGLSLPFVRLRWLDR